MHYNTYNNLNQRHGPSPFVAHINGRLQADRIPVEETFRGLVQHRCVPRQAENSPYSCKTAYKKHPSTHGLKGYSKPISSSHKQYFQRPELRLIKPISSMTKTKSQVTDATDFGSEHRSQYRQISSQPISLDWNHIRRKTEGNLFKKFGLGCNIESKPRQGSFCVCGKPCEWAKRWSSWAKMPKQFIYPRLKDASLKPDVDQQVKKDLKRTQPGKYILDYTYLRMLKQVLEVYSKYDEQVGYVQGMNMLVSVILYHIRNPQQTFWILVDIMERREYREIYLNNFEKLRVHTNTINKLVRLKINDLYLHLTNNGVQLEMITTGWFFSLMCNIIPLQQAHLILDIFITNGFIGFYRVILTYLLFLKQELMIKEDASDILNRFSITYPQDEVDWEEILNSAVCFSLSDHEVWRAK